MNSPSMLISKFYGNLKQYLAGNGPDLIYNCAT
jgi:hypothetical protein